MIEVTEEMIHAVKRKLQPLPFEPTLVPAIAAVLAIVERDWNLSRPPCWAPLPEPSSEYGCALPGGHEGAHEAEIMKVVRW